MEHINLWEDEKLRNQVQFLRELVALYRGSKGARIPCEREGKVYLVLKMQLRLKQSVCCLEWLLCLFRNACPCFILDHFRHQSVRTNEKNIDFRAILS